MGWQRRYWDLAGIGSQPHEAKAVSRVVEVIAGSLDLNETVRVVYAEIDCVDSHNNRRDEHPNALCVARILRNCGVRNCGVRKYGVRNCGVRNCGVRNCGVVSSAIVGSAILSSAIVSSAIAGSVILSSAIVGNSIVSSSIVSSAILSSVIALCEVRTQRGLWAGSGQERVLLYTSARKCTYPA